MFNGDFVIEGFCTSFALGLWKSGFLKGFCEFYGKSEFLLRISAGMCFGGSGCCRIYVEKRWGEGFQTELRGESLH